MPVETVGQNHEFIQMATDLVGNLSCGTEMARYVRGFKVPDFTYKGRLVRPCFTNESKIVLPDNLGLSFEHGKCYSIVCQIVHDQLCRVDMYHVFRGDLDLWESRFLEWSSHLARDEKIRGVVVTYRGSRENSSLQKGIARVSPLLVQQVEPFDDYYGQPGCFDVVCSPSVSDNFPLTHVLASGKSYGRRIKVTQNLVE